MIGANVFIPQPQLVNLYGCSIGDGSKIGAFVEIQRGASVGRNCKVSSHTFICEGVTIEDECFIGHHVVFINDPYPKAANPDGSLQTDADWTVVPTRVERRARSRSMSPRRTRWSSYISTRMSNAAPRRGWAYRCLLSVRRARDTEAIVLP